MDGLLRELDLAHVELTNTRDRIVLVYDGRRLALRLRQHYILEVLRRRHNGDLLEVELRHDDSRRAISLSNDDPPTIFLHTKKLRCCKLSGWVAEKCTRVAATRSTDWQQWRRVAACTTQLSAAESVRTVRQLPRSCLGTWRMTN